MSILEPSNLTKVGPEKCNLPDAQDEGIRIAFMSVAVILKEEIKIHCCNL